MGRTRRRPRGSRSVRATFQRSSGEPLAPVYVGDNGDDIPLPGEFPYTARDPADDVSRAAVDDAPVCGPGGRRGEQPALPLPARPGSDRASRWPSTCRRQIGYDSDAAVAEGEVGKVGVAIDSIEDMRTLFEGIPLDRVTTSMTINSTAATLLSLYAAVAEEQGISKDRIGGTVQNDILKEYIARGTYIYPAEAFDAADHGHVRLLHPRGAALEHDLDFGLPHA